MGIKSEIPLGTKYGKLLVVSEAEYQHHPNGKMKRMVNVRCECGELAIKSWQDVKRGAQKSCGSCKKEMPVKDLSGKRVYKLTVTSKYKIEDNLAHWLCECECGNQLYVNGVRLRNKRIRNCGECGTTLGTYYWGDKISNFEGYEFTLIFVKDRVATLEDSYGRRFNIDYGFLKRGNFCYPYHPSVVGIGCYGVGPYVAKREGRHTEEYENWNSMIKRCYSSVKHLPSYSDKSVCKEWHDFQIFSEWATKQVGFDKEDYHLDKDLLVKDNKVYSPETCVYIPREVNSFIRRYRMNSLPLGVDKTLRYNGSVCYRAQARELGKNINLGFYDTPEEAFSAYKDHKERLAKTLAEKWKGSIDHRAYEALMNYQVEITD